MKFIKLIRKYMDQDDNVYDAGSVLEVSDDVAEELIKGEKAEAHDGVVKEVKPEEIKAEIAVEIKNAVAEAMADAKHDDDDGIEAKSIEVTEDAPMWKDVGEFLDAVIKAERGNVDERLYKATGQSEGTSADGGYLVERRLTNEIAQMAAQGSVLYPKCKRMQVGPNSNGVKIPQVNESERSNTTLFGGVRFYNPGEGVAKTAFKQAYTQEDVALGKICAVNYVTDELLADRVALRSFIAKDVANGFAWVIDEEIINGTLSAMTAIVGDAATHAVTVAGNNPTRDEWMELYRSMAPTSRGKAEWYISNSQFSALPSLEDDGATAIYQPDYRVSPHGTLLGRPVNIMEQCGADTNASSILFLDLSQYLVIERGVIEEATSIHVKFLEDETAFRWVKRIGGAPMLASKVTLPDSTVVSPFVTRDTQ